MARRIAYTGAPVLTPEDIAAWRRDDLVLLESALLRDVIIPGITAQAEEITGAAIQQARYTETWSERIRSGAALDVGQAHTVESIDVISADGVPVPSGVVHYLDQGQRESTLHFAAGKPAGTLRITYLAGIDLAAYPAVRTWLLMQIGTVYAQRETLVIGASIASLPPAFIDTMLSEITVPPRF